MTERPEAKLHIRNYVDGLGRPAGGLARLDTPDEKDGEFQPLTIIHWQDGPIGDGEQNRCPGGRRAPSRGCPPELPAIALSRAPKTRGRSRRCKTASHRIAAQARPRPRQAWRGRDSRGVTSRLRDVVRVLREWRWQALYLVAFGVGIAGIAASVKANPCPALGDCVPDCGQPDGDCGRYAANADSFKAACSWLKANPAKEHVMYAFSSAFHCWGIGGTLQGGIGDHYCRPGGLAGFAGINFSAELHLDAEYKGHMVLACSRASGVPTSVLAAAVGDREFETGSCPGHKQWSAWDRFPDMAQYAPRIKGIPHQDDVPAACHTLQPGPG